MTARTFAEQLRPHVERLGAPACAALCGVTRQTINLWLRGGGNPNHATRAGALLLLGGEQPPPQDHATLVNGKPCFVEYIGTERTPAGVKHSFKIHPPGAMPAKPRRRSAP